MRLCNFFQALEFLFTTKTMNFYFHQERQVVYMIYSIIITMPHSNCNTYLIYFTAKTNIDLVAQESRGFLQPEVTKQICPPPTHSGFFFFFSVLLFNMNLKDYIHLVGKIFHSSYFKPYDLLIIYCCHVSFML